MGVEAPDSQDREYVLNRADASFAEPSHVVHLVFN